jgi:single-stranded DNA-binding protein
MKKTKKGQPLTITGRMKLRKVRQKEKAQTKRRARR